MLEGWLEPIQALPLFLCCFPSKERVRLSKIYAVKLTSLAFVSFPSQRAPLCCCARYWHANVSSPLAAEPRRNPPLCNKSGCLIRLCSLSFLRSRALVPFPAIPSPTHQSVPLREGLIREIPPWSIEPSQGSTKGNILEWWHIAASVWVYVHVHVGSGVKGYRLDPAFMHGHAHTSWFNLE